MSSWAPNNFPFHRILAWIVRRAVFTILLILGISGVFAWQLRNLSFQTSIYDLIIEDLPETVQYNDFKKIFGSDEIIRVVIKAKNIFDPATFRKIEHLSDTATQIKGVQRVISLPEIKIEKNRKRIAANRNTMERRWIVLGVVGLARSGGSLGGAGLGIGIHCGPDHGPAQRCVESRKPRHRLWPVLFDILSGNGQE